MDKIIKQAYKTLGLITFITAGPKKSKAWTCNAGTKAPQAAGKIHTDFEKGFIRAEVIQWNKLLEAGGYVQSARKGWLRVEGKEYLFKMAMSCTLGLQSNLSNPRLSDEALLARRSFSEGEAKSEKHLPLVGARCPC